MDVWVVSTFWPMWIMLLCPKGFKIGKPKGFGLDILRSGRGRARNDGNSPYCYTPSSSSYKWTCLLFLSPLLSVAVRSCLLLSCLCFTTHCSAVPFMVGHDTFPCHWWDTDMAKRAFASTESTAFLFPYHLPWPK